MMLHDPDLTSHARTRMRQRGLRDEDLKLVLATATQVSSDAYMLTRKDVDREIAIRKQEIRLLERLESCKVVVVDGAVVTCFHADRAAQKRALRE
jgi:hypothetical protein